MSKRILAALLCAVAIFAVACGGGNGNGAKGNGTGSNDAGKCGSPDTAAADPYALYKNKGRTWTHKSVTKVAGMDDMVSFMKYEVTEVADDHAMYKMWMLDKDQKPMAGMPEPTPTKVEFKKVEATAPVANAPKVEVKEESIEVKAGKYDCTVTEMSGTKTWMSKKYPGLMVKMEGASNSMELVEFKE